MASTQCPASALPIEILAHIFHFLPCGHDDPPKLNASPPSWLAVTHVCQQWRFASLSHANLWTNVVTTSMAWTKEFLRRSRPVPISLKIESKSTNGPVSDAVVEALSHCSRARRLTLEGLNISRYMAHVRIQPAPHLKMLSLIEHNHESNMDPWIIFMHKEMPELTALVLESILIQWSPPLNLFKKYATFKPTLTELSLSLAIIPPHRRPNVAELREALQSLPLLERLILDQVFRPKHDAGPLVLDIISTPSHPYPTLTLSNLASFFIAGNVAPDISLFVCSLRAPKLDFFKFVYLHDIVSMQIASNTEHLLPLSVGALLSRGTRFLHAGQALVKQPSIRIYDHPDYDGCSVSFEAPTHDTSDVDGGGSETGCGTRFIEVQLCALYPVSPEVARSFVLDLLLVAQDVGWSPHTITVQSFLFTSQDVWRFVFSRARAPLELLRVQGRAVRYLLAALGEDVLREINGEVRALEPMLTELTSLELGKLEFIGVGFPEDVGVDFVEDDGRLFNMLCCALERRECEFLLTRASPLLRLDVRGCNISQEQVEEANRLFIGDLVWDGQEEGLGSTSRG